MKVSTHTRLIFLAFAAIAIAGCQSSVRFSSDGSHSPYKSKPSTGKVTKSKIPPQKQIENSASQTSGTRAAILEEAKLWLGTAYQYGGESRSGADCSGFVFSVFAVNGIMLPRVSSQQYGHSERINQNDLLPADLVFFTKNGSVNHVGIYIGDGNMIHASTSRGVTVESLSLNYYTKHYAGAGRVIADLP